MRLMLLGAAYQVALAAIRTDGNIPEPQSDIMHNMGLTSILTERDDHLAYDIMLEL
jgi:hypothetical protein